jgi:PAS domain S-box-containing protein
VHLLLSARAMSLRQVSAIFVVDRDGVVVNSSRGVPTEAVSVRERAYFKAFAENQAQGLFVDRTARSLRTGAWTMHMARRLSDADGRFRGIVVASLDLAHFEQLYKHMVLDYVRPIALYLDDGTLLASLPHRESDLGDRAAELGTLPLPAIADELKVITRVRRDGVRQQLALGRVNGFPLIVSVANDDEETLADWRETAVMISLTAVVVVVFVALSAIALVMQLRRDERLARALREADERYQLTLETVMDAIVAIDDAGEVVMFNHAAEAMFGRTAASMFGQPLSTLLPADTREVHARHVTSFGQGAAESRPMAPHLEITGQRADGSVFPIESTISRTTIRGRPQLTAVLRDITERRRAEADLKALTGELRRLSAALQSVREEERERISRELHDELGQQLTGLKLDMSWFTLRIQEGRLPDVEAVGGMRHRLDGAIQAVRRISTELRPRILDELGFGEAVAWQAAEFSRRSGVEVVLDLPARALVKRSDLATALFRIVQESLTNVARHAGATRVEISLTNDDECLLLCVRDDGQGLSEGERRGIGLLSMRERANALGGTFRVSAAEGGGTRVDVTVPLEGLDERAGDTQAEAP